MATVSNTRRAGSRPRSPLRGATAVARKERFMSGVPRWKDGGGRRYARAVAVSVRRRPAAVPSVRGQRHADDLLVVADVHAAVRERRVRPDDLPAAREQRRLQEMGTAE